MLDKKQNRAFFYSHSKWVIKQWGQFATPTMHLAQELLTDVQRSGGSRSFAKETRARMIRSAVASWWKVTMTN